jgi:hypothetical protein
MAQPPAYNRAFSFTDYTANHPADQQPGVSLDSEFNALGVTLDAVLENLAKIQRDDGALANGVVTADAISTELTFGLRSIGDWHQATAYVVNDAVWQGSKLYRAAVSHTSAASFTTDLNAGKWTLVTDLAPYAAAAVVNAAIGVIEIDGVLLADQLALKAALAGNNTFTGTNAFNAASTFGANVTVQSGLAASANDLVYLKPSDFGVGKSGLAFRKLATATAWALVVKDSAGTLGSLDLQGSAVTVNGVAAATTALTDDLYNQVRRARNLAFIF